MFVFAVFDRCLAALFSRRPCSSIVALLGSKAGLSSARDEIEKTFNPRTWSLRDQAITRQQRPTASAQHLAGAHAAW